MLDTSAGPALAEAHEAGLTVIVKEGMANGRLAEPHAPGALKAVAEEAALGRDAVALALILRQPWAGVVLSGAATVNQLGPTRTPPPSISTTTRWRASARSSRTRTPTGSGAGSCPGTDCPRKAVSVVR